MLCKYEFLRKFFDLFKSIFYCSSSQNFGEMICSPTFLSRAFLLFRDDLDIKVRQQYLQNSAAFSLSSS